MINEDWKELIENEFKQEYYKKISLFLKSEYSSNKEIYPPPSLIYNALSISPKNISVIIVGQDPYHNPGQANGLSFSVNKNIVLPPSLKNIYKEIENEYGRKMPNHGDLTEWKNQGVLLLNTSLTVEKNKPASHSKIGWQIFTDKIISSLSNIYKNNVYILWGNHAKEKLSLIDKENNLILTSAHPSPFSATKFFNNNHFKLTNEYLVKNNKKPIDWFKI